MSALTTRDALAKALHDIECGCRHSLSHSLDKADALLASGVVVDAATLADDDELVRRVNHPEPGNKLFAGVHPPEVRDVLTVLARVLAERGQQP